MTGGFKMSLKRRFLMRKYFKILDKCSKNINIKHCSAANKRYQKLLLYKYKIRILKYFNRLYTGIVSVLPKA